MAFFLACLSAICFGTALITGKRGLRWLDARAGAAISIPTAMVLFMIASAFGLQVSEFNLKAAALFAVVGLFFPALVTLLTFEANDRLGPTVTSAVSSTAPLFALLAAAMFLDERITARAVLASVGVAAGIAMVTWAPRGSRSSAVGWALLLPISGAVVRGFVLALAKAGLVLWPNPLAASTIGYVVSSTVVVGVDRLPRVRKANFSLTGASWFVITGALNGAAVLFMYEALALAPVALVATIVATYPLVTVLLAATLLRDQPLTIHVAAGSALTVGAIAFLVSG